MSEHALNRRTFAKATGLAAGLLAVGWHPATAAQAAGTPVTAISPDGSIRAHFRVHDGKPEYSIIKSDRTVVEWSGMGFELDDGTRLGQSVQLEAVHRQELGETWHLVWGSASEAHPPQQRSRAARRGRRKRTDP